MLGEELDLREHEVVFSRRRLVFLVVLASAFVGVGAVLSMRGGDESVSDLEVRAQLVGLRGRLCEFESLVSTGQFGPAKNLYWDELHNDSHLLAVVVGKTDKAAEARFLEAHFRVERGLAMLAPSLKSEAPAFANLAEESLLKLKVVGADRPC